MLKKLGVKLRREREKLALTQEELAKSVGLSSEFISYLEIGKRSPSLESIKRISSYLKKDISFFLEEKEMPFSILFKEVSHNKKASAELKKFKKFCEDYLNMEDLTGRRVESAPLYSQVIPEKLAIEERRRLGLGDAPIHNVFSLLEMNGLHILRQSIPEEAKISGIFVYFRAKDVAFALISKAQSVGNQVLTAVHEYYHYIKDRNDGPIIDNPDVFVNEYLSLYHPREKFAQIFSYHFLMPPSKIKDIIERDMRSKKLNFEDVIYLKRYFGVSTFAMLWSLKDLSYLSYSKFKEFQKIDHRTYEKTLFGEASVEELILKVKTKAIPSDRYKSMAVTLYKKKKDKEEKSKKA